MPGSRSAWTATICSGPSKLGLHGRFATPGLQPGAPAGWTNFKAAGDVAPVAGTGGALFNAGGTYPVASTWVTLGDLLGGSGTEYLFWKGSTDPNVLPWNLVEGLVAEPSGEWVVGEDTAKGLYDVTYSCQRCHQLGSTVPGTARRRAEPGRRDGVRSPRPPASGPVTRASRSTTS